MIDHTQQPNLDDVDQPTESVRPDHHQHSKLPRPLDDEALEQRTQQERDATGAGGPVEP